MENGYVHIYTGKGKGKTTAAIGLAIRAAGAGKKVLFTQFLKAAHSSEHHALQHYSDKITLRSFGDGKFIKGEVTPEQIHAAQEGLDEVALLMLHEKYEVVVLDEGITALNLNLFTIDELLDVIHERPYNVEIILTGRDAPQVLINAADLVTEMVEVKHYFHNGITARKGIEF